MHRRLKGQGGENRELVGGVDAVHVVGGVRLGVAQALGILQGIVERAAFRGHAGEDVVGGAVEDGLQADDAVGHQILPEGADERDAAAHAGLEGDVHAVLGGQGQQLRAVLGHDLLVGGDDVLAVLQGAAQVVHGRVLAAHGLEDHGDAGVVQDLPGVGGEQLRRHGHGARLIGVAHQHLDDAGGPVHARGDPVGVLGEDAVDAAAHRAQAQHTDMNG